MSEIEIDGAGTLDDRPRAQSPDSGPSTAGSPPTETARDTSGVESTLARQLAEKIANRSARIAVVGLGYVGLPVLGEFHRAGFPVTGFDNDPAKIEQLRAGVPYLRHTGDDLPASLRDSDRFVATSDENDLTDADVVILCVPTPLTPHRDPDLRYVETSAELAARTARVGRLVILESTSYPGTTRGLVSSRLENAGLAVGRDAFVAYSPERYDPGRSGSIAEIPKLVGGADAASLDLATQLYRTAFDDVRPVSSCEVAESAKLVENIYRSVNIALVNELKPLFHDMGIDLWEVLDAAATKPFGFQKFIPGPGLGGHCLPVDPFYLTWKAKEFGHRTRFIELAGEIHREMPGYVVSRLSEALNERGRSVKNARILVIGIAYKKNVDDIRETPAAPIITALQSLGAMVDYHDPWIPEFPRMRDYAIDLTSIPLATDDLRSRDAVVITTDHDGCDWDLVAEHADLVIDTRNTLGDRSPNGTWIRS